MNSEMVTKEDLRYFREQLLEDIKKYLRSGQESTIEPAIRLKTKQVQKILGCSYGKVQSLRVSGKLTCKKIGGTLYYKQKDIKKLLEGLE